MITLEDIYKQFKTEYGADTSGWFRIQGDFVPAVHNASLKIFNYLAAQDGKSQVIEDMLTPFVRSENVSVKKVGNSWIALYPKDYKYYKAAGVVYDTSGKACADPEADSVNLGAMAEDFAPSTSEYRRLPLELVKSNHWSAASSHPTRKPKANKPKMRQGQKGFEVLPEGIGVIVLDYYRLPEKATYEYSVKKDGVDEFIVYDTQMSKPLEWGEETIPVFIYLLGKTYGLNIKDELISQLSRMDKTLENL